MKNLAFVVVCVLFIVQAMGQMYPGLKTKSVIDGGPLFPAPREIVLPPFNQQWADSLDAADTKYDRLPKIGRYIDTDINPDNAGNWTILPNGGRVWRVQITSNGALGLIPLFNKLYLPPGATLHAYTPDFREIQGAYTNLNTLQMHAFNPGLVHGQTCIVEYYEPPAELGKGILNISRVTHCYRGIDKLERGIESGSASCEVNVACPEGDNWRNQIRSVCRVNVFDLTGAGYCSGALVNNVRQDCTPYLLTAGHCTDYDSATAQEFDQYWSFLFNYQCNACGSTNCNSTEIITGCTRVAYAYDSNGIDGSDFLLLLMNSYPPADFNVYYSGWDNTGSVPDSGVGIHHPAGDCKKISTVKPGSIFSSSWANNVQNTHWQLNWEATVSGNGVTEPGSSGSPLYEPSGLIVGHLTGGGSCCTADGCGSGTGPNSPDFYGKIAFDWTSNGVTPDRQLGPWLDPDNTGATTLQGINPPCGISTHDDVGIQQIEVPTGNICGLTFTPCFTIHNYGDDTLRSLILTYTVDNNPTQSQFIWTGLLPGGAEIEVCSGASYTTTGGAHTFTVVASRPNGVTNNNSSNNVLESTFNTYPAPGAVTLVFNTDNDGTQDTWQLTQQGGTLVASGGPFVDCVGGRQYIYPLCLSPDCYTFTVFDSEGDGMTDGEDGFVQLWAGTTMLGQLATPSFGAQGIFTFCIWPTAIEDIPAINLTVLPNPSTGIFNVYFDDDQQKSVRLYDPLGRQLMDRTTTERHFNLDLSAFSKGVYFAEFNTPQGKVVRKLVVD